LGKQKVQEKKVYTIGVDFWNFENLQKNVTSTITFSAMQSETKFFLTAKKRVRGKSAPNLKFVSISFQKEYIIW